MTPKIEKILTMVLAMMLVFQLFALSAHAADGADAVAAPAPWAGSPLPRSQASLDLQKLLEADPALMAMMEKSIARAAEINPDRETNPV